ncbi:MAG: zinc ribbon domain-containing protein [Dehalococcoidia bacterium]|nr:zinc ribbon domain-containing protein [Dehalococcoidia bacterium]
MAGTDGLSTDTLYCHNCGARISRSYAFCTSCGTVVVSCAVPKAEEQTVTSHLPQDATEHVAAPSTYAQLTAEPLVATPVGMSGYAAPNYATFSAPASASAPAPAAPKQSGAGIASFIIACVACITMMATTISCTASLTADLEFDDIPEAIFLLFLLSIGMLLIGVSTGIIGVVQSGRKKLFAILGLTFNTLMLLPIIIIFIVALLMV